ILVVDGGRGQVNDTPENRGGGGRPQRDNRRRNVLGRPRVIRLPLRHGSVPVLQSLGTGEQREAPRLPRQRFRKPTTSQPDHHVARAVPQLGGGRHDRVVLDRGAIDQEHRVV